jgi:mono/diheme cytochrome c family protein
MHPLPHYITLIVLSGSIFAAARASSTQASRPLGNVPTPVYGESWLTHLSRTFNDTSMGKTGALGPAAGSTQRESPVAPSLAPPAGDIAFSGADLYRLNCRACHGEQGLGAPPEINSVINPVKGTSALLVTERMKSRGLDISASSATELANEAKASLLKRLHEGGENMPSFSYLTEPEIASIISYLDQLAQVPRAANTNTLVRESPERIGELIVKSTCHICHGATGANPTEQELYEGQIPPLGSLPSRIDQAHFIRKITRGLPILMGAPPSFFRGRMPVFSYITPQEAADAYLYLNYYPPVSKAQSFLVASSIQQPMGPTTGGGPAAPLMGPKSGPLESRSNETLPASVVFVIAGLCGFVVVLIAGGFAFTIHEFSRMSGEHEHSHVPNLIPTEQQPEETSLVHT